MGAAMGRQVVVIGAGILGAASAYHLQRAGAQVTIVDRGGPSATAASFGWINASYYQTPDHHALRVEGIAAYRRLCAVLQVPVSFSGCLCWDVSGSDLDVQYAALTQMGYAVQQIDAARFAQLEPHVANPPERCLHFTTEAAADAGALAAALLQAAEAMGAKRVQGVEVTGFDRQGEQIIGVQTSAGRIAADEVLLAAGTASTRLMALADTPLPMLHRPGLILRTRPVAPLIQHVLVSDIGEVRQRHDGALLMPTAVGHQGDDATQLLDSAPAIADQALARLQAMLPGVALDWAEVTLAHRPVPQDGLPVVGRVRPGLYVATMHSGITLGALMGELVAQELLDQRPNHAQTLLASYRPERFL